MNKIIMLLMILLIPIVFGAWTTHTDVLINDDINVTSSVNYEPYKSLMRIDCADGEVNSWNDTSSEWICAGAGSGDITGVTTAGNYLTGGSLSGQVDLLFNSTYATANLKPATCSLADDSTAWITMTSLQAKWFADVGNVLTFDETELNTTIDARDTNCSVAGTCSDIAYLDYANSGDFNVTGNVTLSSGFLHMGTLSRGFENLINTVGDQVIGNRLFTENMIMAFAPSYGPALMAHEYSSSLNITSTGGTASLNATTKVICDSADPFVAGNAGMFLTVINSTPSFTDATGEITNYLNSTCIVISFASAGGASIVDAASMTYYVYPAPVFAALDNGVIHMEVGENAEAKVHVNILNGTGFTGVSLDDVAGADQHQAFTINQDMQDYDGIVGLNMFTDSSTGANATNYDQIVLEMRTGGINNSELHFLSFDVVGEGVNNDIDVLHILGDVDHIIHQGSEDTLTNAYVESVDETYNFTTNGAGATLFENVNEYVYVGSAVNFTSIAFALSTSSNKNLLLEYYYCNSSNEWDVLSGVTDTTDGMQTSGTITFVNPSDRGVCNTEYDGTAFANTTSVAYIAFKRTLASVQTEPVESLVSVGGSTTLMFLQKDMMKLDGSVGGPVNCSANYAGAWYYDSTGVELLWCDGASWQAFAMAGDVTVHNSLSGLQGGTAAQYYHLDATEYGFLDGQNQAVKTTSDVTFDNVTVSDEFTDGTLTITGGGITSVGTLTASGNLDIGAYDFKALTFTSDQANGTAPFTVASTTAVNNLAADYWDALNSPTDITSLGTISSATSITSSAFVGPLTGNADTVTNGVYTNGSYNNPVWVTALNWTKLQNYPADGSAGGNYVTVIGDTLTYDIPEIVYDTTPTLGGNLVCDSNNVTGFVEASGTLLDVTNAEIDNLESNVDATGYSITASTELASVTGDFDNLEATNLESNLDGTGFNITVDTLTGDVTGTASIATTWSGETSQANLNVNDSDTVDGVGMGTITSTKWCVADGTTEIDCTVNPVSDTTYNSDETYINEAANVFNFNATYANANLDPATCDLADVATLANTVVVIDGTDTSSFVAIFDSATGSLPVKTDNGLLYNAGTGMLSATGFSGPLTGTADVATTWASVTSFSATWFDDVGNVLTFNDTRMNATIDARSIASVHDDTTPQLGGYLDADGENIGSTSDEIENIYVGTTTRIYFGDGQEGSMYSDGTYLYITG